MFLFLSFCVRLLKYSFFLENPSKSIRDCRRDLQYSYSKVQETLKKYHMHDFKYTKVQQLSELDKQRRLEFCRFMLGQLDENPDFFNRILWTDESHFNTACPPNLKNLHFWAAENPRKTLEVKRSGRQSIGVWCGIIKNRVIGKIFYNGSLTGARYLELLQTQIEEEINMLPLNIFRNLIWQQDGAPAHSVLAVREYLNANYNMWIGRNGTIIWPPNSPDLTPLDTFLWGYLKSKVYMDRTQNIEDIIMKIVEEIDDLNNHPEIINRTIENLIKRYRLCVEVNGGHFEQFL